MFCSSSVNPVPLRSHGIEVGLILPDQQRGELARHCHPPLSRRTAERLRDALERVFSQLELVNPNALPKRWRLPAGRANDLATVTTDELADLTILQPLFRYFIDTARKQQEQTNGAERVISK